MSNIKDIHHHNTTVWLKKEEQIALDEQKRIDKKVDREVFNWFDMSCHAQAENKVDKAYCRQTTVKGISIFTTNFDK